MGEVKQKASIAYFELMSGLFLFLVLLLVLFTAAAGNNSIFLVLMGFFPTVLVIIISLLIYDQYIEQRKMLWAMPVVIVGLFYFIGKATPSITGGLDIDILSSINFILSVIYVLVTFSVFRNYKKYAVEGKTIHHHTHHTHQTHNIHNKKTEEPKICKPEELQQYVASIEDKSKALNFAIGRVYSQFHGGSEEIRNKLRIPKDWYNEFSLIGIGTNTVDYVKLNEIIAKFEVHLRVFEKSEKEVFGKRVENLKNLIHDVVGRDKIIDVLDHNDKDPVRSYYEGALNFCKKVREDMRNRELKLVKNTYIPKNEEEKEEIKKLTSSTSDEKKGKYFPRLEKKTTTKSKESKKSSKGKTSTKEDVVLIKDVDEEERKPSFNHP